MNRQALGMRDAWRMAVCVGVLAVVLAAGARPSLAGSVFSREGPGEIVEPIDVRSRGMGGCSVAFVEGRNASKTNPAVWCTFDQAAIGVEFTSEQRTVRDGAYKHSFFGGSPGALKVLVPLGYDVVLAAGLWPYGRAQLCVVEDLPLGQGELADSTYQQRVERTGGVHLVAVGMSRKLRSWLWVGLNLDFPFGTIQERWVRSFADPGWVDTEEAISRSFSGVVPSAGVVWRLGGRGALGVSYTPQVKLDSPGTVKGVTERDATGGNTTTLPSRVALGGTHRFTKTLALSAEVNAASWEDACRSYPHGDRYRDVVSVGLGAAYRPDPAAKSSYYERVGLVVGARTGAHYYTFGNPPEAVRERLLSFGLELPFAQGQATVQMSFEVGKRGDLSQNGAEELVYRQSIGVCGWEKWFQRD